MGDFKVGDSVVHPHLGAGEIVEIRKSLGGIPIHAMVDLDRDPEPNYNMGANPALLPLSDLTKE